MKTGVVFSEPEAYQAALDGRLIEFIRKQDQRNEQEFLEHGKWFRSPKCTFPACGWPTVVRWTDRFLECRSFARNRTGSPMAVLDICLVGVFAFFYLVYYRMYRMSIVSVKMDAHPMGDAGEAAMMLPWIVLGVALVARLFISFRTIPRQKWTVVRFLRHEQVVAVNHAWPAGSELAQTGRERIYSWNQLNPVFRRDLSDAHLPVLGVLVMDATRAVDYLEFGLGIGSPGTAREQWELLRRYMTFDTAPMPAARRVWWYTSPFTAWREAVDYFTLLVYPNVRAEPFVLWTRFVSAVFNFVADLIRWQPMWSEKVLLLSGQQPWREHTKAVLQTLTGWTVFGGLAFGVWWLVDRW